MSAPAANGCARAVEDERLLGRIEEIHAVNYYATATGAPGRRCDAAASRSAEIASSG